MRITQANIFDALRKQTGADPSILERTVFAFGFLEALCRVKILIVAICVSSRMETPNLQKIRFIQRRLSQESKKCMKKMRLDLC